MHLVGWFIWIVWWGMDLQTLNLDGLSSFHTHFLLHSSLAGPRQSMRLINHTLIHCFLPKTDYTACIKNYRFLQLNILLLLQLTNALPLQHIPCLKGFPVQEVWVSWPSEFYTHWMFLHQNLKTISDLLNLFPAYDNITFLFHKLYLLRSFPPWIRDTGKLLCGSVKWQIMLHSNCTATSISTHTFHTWCSGMLCIICSVNKHGFLMEHFVTVTV